MHFLLEASVAYRWKALAKIFNLAQKRKRADPPGPPQGGPKLFSLFEALRLLCSSPKNSYRLKMSAMSPGRCYVIIVLVPGLQLPPQGGPPWKGGGERKIGGELRKVPSVTHEVTCARSKESVRHIFDDLDLELAKVTVKVILRVIGNHHVWHKK